jgi:hypothetical protein
LAGIAAIKEGLFEGYYGSSRESVTWASKLKARLVIKHNRVLGEDDKRYRYVESLFIETADQERFGCHSKVSYRRSSHAGTCAIRWSSL